MNQKIALKQLKELKKYSKKMRLAAEKWENQWQTLIAIILSARNRDEKTIPVCLKLFKKYPSPEKLAKTKLEEIEKIIRPINFYKNKSRNIQKCSRDIIENYNGKIPLDEEELLKLPGVGRKTANVFLSEMGKQAIGVDTHVNYISQKLDWTKNQKPEKIEEDLKKLFSKNYWKKINPILVRFGKTYTNHKEKDKLLEQIKIKTLN